MVAKLATIPLFGAFDGYHGLEERLWSLVAQVWVLLCATALILEATLEREAIPAPSAGIEGTQAARA